MAKSRGITFKCPFQASDALLGTSASLYPYRGNGHLVTGTARRVKSYVAPDCQSPRDSVSLVRCRLGTEVSGLPRWGQISGRFQQRPFLVRQSWKSARNTRFLLAQLGSDCLCLGLTPDTRHLTPDT
jgi:hypothetical protein